MLSDPSSCSSEIHGYTTVIAVSSFNGNPHDSAVKVVAFAYGGMNSAQSPQLYAIGDVSFRCILWLLAMLSTYVILRLMEGDIGAGSS